MFSAAGRAQTKAPASHSSTPSGSKPAARSAPSKTTAAPSGERQLTALARDLHDHPAPAAYDRLAAFARDHAKTTLGRRADLALGYCEFTQNSFSQARTWLDQAAADPLLADYALYWRALTDRADGANAEALEELQRFRRSYPNSVMSDTAVTELAQAALALDQPAVAVETLEAYAKTTNKASLVLLRAQAREKDADEKGEKPFAATTDYLDLVYRFPLSDEAKTASAKIPGLQAALGEQFPGTPLTNEMARAEAFYDARRWDDLRSAYQDLLPKLSGADHDRAELRIAEADVQSGRSVDELGSLAITDPELEAARLFDISQAQRTAKSEADMFASLEQIVVQHPQSPWAEEALYAGGNYRWADLDRDGAAEFYQRLLAAFPSGRYASVARWRIAWTAYLERKPDAAIQLEEFVRQYPTSPYVVDALYWLGRANDRAGNTAVAQSYYRAAAKRFPQTYFGEHAAGRVQGAAATGEPDVISVIPPLPPIGPIDGTVPAAASPAWSRAQALESIAFDNSAELELRGAYVATHSPRLLLDEAEAAVSGARYAAGISDVRQLAPQLESRQIKDLPDEVWRTAFPLPYRDALEREARRNDLDPMLVAGLIRQESAFASDAVSRSNALGLMQLIPPTGAEMARLVKVQFSRARLFDPEYNVRLGTVYLSNLLTQLQTPEAALAAYNAGPDRVAAWTAGQNYEEAPEFVESIPFNETRDYVQIVLRNADLYRRLYGSKPSVEKQAMASAN